MSSNMTDIAIVGQRVWIPWRSKQAEIFDFEDSGVGVRYDDGDTEWFYSADDVRPLSEVAGDEEHPA